MVRTYGSSFYSQTEAEDKLCNPSAQLETGNNTDNDFLLKEIEHEYEKDCGIQHSLHDHPTKKSCPEKWACPR